MVVDLRWNGGGSLTEAVNMSGPFINTGPVVQVKDGRGRTQPYNDPDPGLVWPGPLVVMINKFSASASEIFAGAIQDYGRGIILFRGVVVETICRMILQLLALKMLAVHAALIGVLGFIPVREHHVVSDFLLLKVSVRATAGTLAVSARPDLLLPSL